MKTRMKALWAFALSLLLITALAGCGQKKDATISGVSVTVEAAGVYELVCESDTNTEGCSNADSSAMKGDYLLETLPPCRLTAYGADHKVLATIDLTEEQADTLVKLTLTEQMEFVQPEP